MNPEKVASIIKEFGEYNKIIVRVDQKSDELCEIKNIEEVLKIMGANKFGGTDYESLKNWSLAIFQTEVCLVKFSSGFIVKSDKIRKETKNFFKNVKMIYYFA